MSTAVVLSAAALLVSLFAVATAIGCYFASRAATKRQSTASLRAELDELRDSFEKNSALLKRIHQRTVMQERRASPQQQDFDSPQQQPGETPAQWKARVRPQLIKPGRPAAHR